MFDDSEEIESRLPYLVMDKNNFVSSVYTPDMGIALATTPRIRQRDTWSDCKHSNTVDFFVCAFCNSRITLSKVYIRRTSDKTIILHSCFLHILPRYSNLIAEKGLNLFDECAARCIYLSP